MTCSSEMPADLTFIMTRRGRPSSPPSTISTLCCCDDHLGHRLDIGDDVEDLLWTCLDHNLAGIAGSHGVTITGHPRRQGRLWTVYRSPSWKSGSWLLASASGTLWPATTGRATRCAFPTSPNPSARTASSSCAAASRCGDAPGPSSTSSAARSPHPTRWPRASSVKRIVRHNVTNIRFTEVTPAGSAGLLLLHRVHRDRTGPLRPLP